MFPRFQRSLGVALRLAIAAGCCAAIWQSWKLAHADYLFRQDNVTSIRQAISLVPDAWPYYMRLAQFEPAHAEMLLTTAERLNRYNAEADIELGLQYESQGDLAKAEQWLLQASTVDHTYLPRWTLANFYLRRGNMPAFWVWARKAAAMPSDHTEALFALCWRVTPDPNAITRKIVDNNPKLLRQYLAFLLGKDQLPAAAEIATRLIRFGDPNEDTHRMFSAIDQLVAAGDGTAANSVWTTLIAKHWVVADPAFPNNPNFARMPLPVSFDWRIPSNPGYRSVPGPLGLETEFSGLEPEACTLAEQAVVLHPGNYILEYSYRTEGIHPGTGLHWEISAPGAKSPLAESPDLSSETRSRARFSFSVPPGVSVVHLRLLYRRALGTPLISGTLLLSSVQIAMQAGANKGTIAAQDLTVSGMLSYESGQYYLTNH